MAEVLRAIALFMNVPDNNSQQILLTHAVLTGLTPLIPIPLVDDLFYVYFMRSMASRLAAKHSRTLSSENIKVLVDQPSRGCALGCISTVFLYGIKKVLRKVFFFLEWKRAADIISHTYYWGYLLDVALDEGWIETHGAAKVRLAIENIIARTNTSLITRSIYGVVRQSKGLFKSLIGILLSALPGAKRNPSESEVARAVDAVESEENERLGGLISQLQKVIGTLPAEHFQGLRLELEKEIAALANTQLKPG